MTIKTERPYAIGFNGHARFCPCSACHKSRMREIKKWVAKQPPLPESFDPYKTVYVNAYFRSTPRKRKQVMRKLRLVG